MRNSTATSGLPCAARRQARTSASGKPMDVRLLTTSAGNSDVEEGAGGGATAEVVGAGVAGVVVVVMVEGVVVVGAGVGGVGVGAGADVAGADVGAGAAGADAAGAGAGAGVVALGVAVFLAFVIIHTRKSLGLIWHASMVTSSFRTFPE